MINSSPVPLSRGLEMLNERRCALGDAMAAETGVDDPERRLIAAMLASVHRILYAEARRRSLARRAARKDLRDAGRSGHHHIRPAGAFTWRYGIEPVQDEHA